MSNQSNQYLSDKIKSASETGHAWLTYGKKRLKIELPNGNKAWRGQYPNFKLGNYSGQLGFVKNRHGIELAIIVLAGNGRMRVHTARGTTYYATDKSLMAMVIEVKVRDGAVQSNNKTVK